MNRYAKMSYSVLMCTLLLSNAAGAVVPFAPCEEPRVSVIIGDVLRQGAQRAMLDKFSSDVAIGCVIGGCLLLESAYNLWYAIPELDIEIARLAQQPVKAAADGLPYAYALSKRARLYDSAMVSVCFVSVAAVVAGVVAYTTYRSEKAEQKKREQQAKTDSVQSVVPAATSTSDAAQVPVIAA